MPTYELTNGKTVSANTIVDFDATHTNTVSSLSPEDFALFVVQTIPDPPPPPPPPITQVTPRQARLALYNAGLLDQVNAAVTAVGGDTQITWEYATVIDRADPLITQLSTALNLSSDQIDALFQQAGSL